MTKNGQDQIYPKEIRKYEQKLIDFIIESGKSKRKSELESHILAYFLLHPSITQKQIQNLSSKFRKKEISRGAISNFLNQYLSYEPKIIKKEKVKGSKNKFRYYFVRDNIADLFSISQEVGITLMVRSIKNLNEMISSLKTIVPHEKDVELKQRLLKRIVELRDYFIYHMALLDKFMAGNTGKKFTPNEIEFEDLQETTIIEKHMKYNGIEHLEQDLIAFISEFPLFVFEEMKYQPIIAFLITREKLTQSELQELTGLSSGLISEGLNYLKNNRYITVEKIKGIRQRKYTLPSIGYFNMFKFYNRFQDIANQKQKLDDILKEIDDKKEELQDLDGYDLVKKRTHEFLKSLEIVDKAVILFSDAKNDFKTKLKQGLQ